MLSVEEFRFNEKEACNSLVDGIDIGDIGVYLNDCRKICGKCFDRLELGENGLFDKGALALRI